MAAYGTNERRGLQKPSYLELSVHTVLSKVLQVLRRQIITMAPAGLLFFVSVAAPASMDPCLDTCFCVMMHPGAGYVRKISLRPSKYFLILPSTL